MSTRAWAKLTVRSLWKTTAFECIRANQISEVLVVAEVGDNAGRNGRFRKAGDLLLNPTRPSPRSSVLSPTITNFKDQPAQSSYRQRRLHRVRMIQRERLLECQDLIKCIQICVNQSGVLMRTKKRNAL